MPARCSIPGCTTKAQPGSGPRFYCIPSEINFTGKASPLRVSRRKKWISALKLQHFTDSQLKNIRICGRHFVTGKPADQYFVHHPDWVPSQNLDGKDRTVSSSTSKMQIINKPEPDEPPKKQTNFMKKYQSSSSSSEDVSEDFHVEEVNKYSMPQKRCCVASCLNRISKTKNSSPQIYYFKFPDDPLTRFRWMFLCQKKGTWDPDQCYICSIHFVSENFIRDGCLKPSSVPTESLFTDSKKEDGHMIQLEGKAGICSIPWCKTKRSEENKMEPFPLEETMKNSWIELIFGAKVPVFAWDSCIICQDHFSKREFLTSEDSKEKMLKVDAVPSIFTNPRLTSMPAKDKEKTIMKKKSESIKEKESKIRNPLEINVKEKISPVKENKSTGSINNNNNNIETEKKLDSNEKEELFSECSIKVIQVGKVIKTQLLSDHTYSGLDSSGNETNSDIIIDGKKRKGDSLKHLQNIKKKQSKESTSDDKYNKDVEDLIADLLGEDGVNDCENLNNTNSPDEQKLNTSTSMNEDLSDSLGDYSDYSESDSDSEFDQEQLKNLDGMSGKDLRELAEAQKYQLDDLKSENKELIEENEKLRKALSIAQSDPKYAYLNSEKNKFLSLVAKMFQKFLNEDQILSLIKSSNPSTAIAWTNETINKAVTIQEACSHTGYDLLLNLGFPLPPRRLLSMIERNKFNMDNSESQ